MRTDSVKKYVIPNIPYLFILWACLKLGTAYRLAAGADFAHKLLGLGQTIGPAFADFAPGLAPFDWLVGIVGAAAFRLLIYVKSKNAKKYRRDEEYGSSRWGTAKDIQPFVDPKFENNIILTGTEFLTMNTRPKNPANARNLNACVIGSSGSGKTRFWLTPQILQASADKKAGCSYVVVDPKGGVLGQVGRFLQRRGYKIKVFNSIDFSKSMHYNPLAYIRNEADILKFVDALISNTKGEGKEGDPFWQKAETLLYCALIAYIIFEGPAEDRNMNTLVDMISGMEVKEDDENFQNAVDYIVINSLRIEEVPFLPYMDRPADTKAGCKHRCTDAALRYFKSEVMEMCHREGLYQIDLLNGSKNRITDREYWAQKKGQAALDKQNAPMIADGITPRQTKFETNKEKLRQTIRKALATAASFDEFSSLLLREGVTVKESRGRLSYLTPDRTKPITARKLGDDFDRTAVLAVLEQNAARAIEKAAAIPEYPWQEKRGIQPAKAPQTAPKQDGVQRLVDIEQKMAEGKGRGYERWAKIHNLKQAAKTLSVYQQYGFTSPEQLEAAVDTAYAEMRQTSGELKALETKLQGKKELQRQVLAYAQTKPARDGLKAQKSEKARAAYRQAHESDFIIADAAARYFKAHGITKLPARKALQAEIEQLISEKDGLYNTYHEQKQRFKELQTVKRNINQILRRDEPHRRKEQSHER